MTESQKAFEALFKEVFPIQHHDWFEKDSLGYVSHSTNNGYKLYLATRKQALEEAVAICKNIPYQNDSYVAGVTLCTSAIERLIK